MASIRTRPKPWPSPLVLGKTPPVFFSFFPAVKLGKEMYSWVPFMSIYTRITRLSGGRAMLASMALSNRLPMIQHRSIWEVLSFTGM